MEEIQFGSYLMNPKQVQIALNLLDENSHELNIEELYDNFQNAIGIQPGDGFPITAGVIDGMICRARVNGPDFERATSVSQIGAKSENILQGRANPDNMSIFYGANNKSTAAFEVLQGKDSGLYCVTIGCWASEKGLRLVNLVDGKDTDFSKLSFAHSMPNDYVNDWPELPRKSALLLIDYFRERFKMPESSGLYRITNVIAGICYSLQNIDGIGYASISDKFEGYNIAIPDPSKLKCVEVERWLIKKINDNEFQYRWLEEGILEDDGVIQWNS